ncbi:hypothetical protein HMPREF1242_0595 [Streptococcus pyogenes GA40884]|nr:hypothetical protein HMPREF1242_0595 [Streptococcus pyogenes GA40884]
MRSTANFTNFPVLAFHQLATHKPQTEYKSSLHNVLVL